MGQDFPRPHQAHPGRPEKDTDDRQDQQSDQHKHEHCQNALFQVGFERSLEPLIQANQGEQQESQWDDPVRDQAGPSG